MSYQPMLVFIADSYIWFINEKFVGNVFEGARSYLFAHS